MTDEIREKPQLLPPLTLAFVGDAVFELFMRTKLLEYGKRNVQSLHQETVKRVNATAQAKLYDLIYDSLEEDERAVLKRGRNAKSKHQSKSASVIEYKKSTGIEALVGYWYLKNEEDKIQDCLMKIQEII